MFCFVVVVVVVVVVVYLFIYLFIYFFFFGGGGVVFFIFFHKRILSPYSGFENAHIQFSFRKRIDQMACLFTTYPIHSDELLTLRISLRWPKT